MTKLDSEKFKILIVDDVTKNIQVLGNILRETGFQTGFATNGKQALSLLQKNHYDLVLLDVMMPEIDGFEVCRQIRRMESLRDLPVIFLTARVDNESTIEGFHAGGQDYVTKPFNQDELLARVNTHLELKEKREKLSAMNDILDQKVQERTVQLESAIEKLNKANQELLYLDQAKSQFIDLIAHEIRTPLGGILGMTYILQTELNSTEYIEFIDLLKDSAERLEKFSMKALLITQLQAGKYVLNLKNFQIGDLAEQLIEELKETSNQKQLKFDFESTPGLSLTADQELVKICLESVLRNAIRFSPEKETIKIRIYQNQNSLIIEIVDQGNGFSQKALDNLYEMFGVGEKPIDQNFGLDLALVKKIIDAHSALIFIQNTYGSGTCVRLIFPIDES